MTIGGELLIPSGRNVVAGGIDDNMVYPTLVWAHSLDRAASRPIHFVIGHLQGNLSTQHQEWLTSTLSRLSISHQFVELPNDSRFITQGHISPTTFTKFQLADLISGAHVWIDIDTVGSKSWDSVFDLILASPKDSLLLVARRYGDRESVVPMNQGPPSTSFNAGVLAWPNRSRLPWNVALDSAELRSTQEQQLFNDLYSKHVAFVPHEFNALAYHYEGFNSERAPAILHFAGAHKPWHLPRRYSRLCKNRMCPWSIWFWAEDSMLRDISKIDGRSSVWSRRRYSLHSGKVFLDRANRGREFLRLLTLLGALGWLPVFLLLPFARFAPRGTHPLH